MSAPAASPSTPAASLKTPFHDFHIEHKARMVDYAGWQMPLLYGSIIEEHHQVRRSAGFFDVSHMGRVRFTGRHARRFLDRVCTRQIHGMENGQCRYSLVCNELGGVRDDVIVYRFDDDEYLMVCNAANRAKLLDHFAAVRGDLVFRMEDQTLDTAMLAIQGPRVMEIISKLSREIPTLKKYRFVEKNLLVLKMIVSRTGYTGEDGVEIILGRRMVGLARTMLLRDVDSTDAIVRPIGLGARDTLRLEAGMPLYGHELDETIDPLSAGLAFAVKLDKGDDDDRIGTFIGQEALRAIATSGPSRRLIGLVLDGRRSPRQGMPVRDGDREVGVITSGCMSPTLDRPIAMALVESGSTPGSAPGSAPGSTPGLAAIGRVLQVDIKGSIESATVSTMPFVKRPPA